MTVLTVAKQRAGSSDFQISHSDFEAGAELRIFSDSLKSLLSNIGQLLALCKGKVCICTPTASADAPSDLMKLCKPELVCIFNNEGVNIGNINTCFNNCGANENIDFTLQQLPPHIR